MEFVSLDQLREAHKWFSTPIHPSSRRESIACEHYWQRWFERLPKGLSSEPKRTKMVNALQAALEELARSG